MGTKEFHLVTLGEVLVDMFPAEVGCRLDQVRAFLPTPGGAPANVAVAAVRLGYRSAFIGKVGSEMFGEMLVNVLKENGVETRGVLRDPQVRTTLAFIGMPDANTYEVIFYRNPGADHCLREDELDRTLLENARALHGGSLSLTHEPARTAHYAAVEIARAAGALISFDVNYRPALWSDLQEARQVIMEMLSRVDVLKVNETELELLTGSRDVERAVPTLLKDGPQLIAVTLGQYGSYFCTAQAVEFVPPFRVPTVDAVGCGDAFVAGLICQLVKEDDWRSRLSVDNLRRVFRYANAVGAVTALARGVIPALPTAERVERFLQENGG